DGGRLLGCGVLYIDVWVASSDCAAPPPFSSRRFRRNHLAVDRRSSRGSHYTLSHQVGLQLADKTSAGTLIRRAKGFREPNENPRARRNRDPVALRSRSGMSAGDIANPV